MTHIIIANIRQYQIDLDTCLSNPLKVEIKRSSEETLALRFPIGRSSFDAHTFVRKLPDEERN